MGGTGTETGNRLQTSATGAFLTIMEDKTMSYCYSTNEEMFYGDYETELEALGAAFDEIADEDEDNNHTVWVGQSVLRKAGDYVDKHDIENLIEAMIEGAHDDCGESAEDWLEPPYHNYFAKGGVLSKSHDEKLAAHKAEQDDLLKRIQEVVNQWADQYGHQPTFYHVHSTKEVTRDQYEALCAKDCN